MLLMHENIPVADVDIYLGHISNVNKIITPEHLPVGTNHPGPMLAQYLDTWLRDRAIPYNRKSLDIYNKYFGCTAMEAAQYFGSFSLTDHYWFKEKDSSEKWEDLCFQNNGFSTNFADFFLEYITGNIPNIDRIYRIPDINTDGVLPKIWLPIDGEMHLYKFGECDSAKGINLLSANEVACSKIARLMNLNAVEYNAAYLPGTKAPMCECKNFIPKDMEFVTLAQIARADAGKQIDLYGKVCKMGYKKEVEDMLRLFFLVHNKDGHTKNCGFLRNAKTLEIESFAPLFDHGCSLNYDGLGSLDQSVKPFRASRLEQIALVENIGQIPNFDDVTDIIKETYSFFGVPDTHLDLAIQDLIETYKEWEKIIEKESTHDEIEFF